MATRWDTFKTRVLGVFKNAPNYTDLLECIFNRVNDTDQILFSLALERWIETAQGVWLDRCGKIVGLYPRPAQLVDDEYVFTCKAISDPDDIDKGFADVTQTFGGLLADIGGLESGDLVDDDTYEKYIDAKAYSTSSACAERNIVMFCRDVFGIDVDVDTPSSGVIVATPTAPVDTQTRRIIEQLAPVVAGATFRVEIV